MRALLKLPPLERLLLAPLPPLRPRPTPVGLVEADRERSGASPRKERKGFASPEPEGEASRLPPLGAALSAPREGLGDRIRAPERPPMRGPLEGDRRSLLRVAERPRSLLSAPPSEPRGLNRRSLPALSFAGAADPDAVSSAFTLDCLLRIMLYSRRCWRCSRISGVSASREALNAFTSLPVPCNRTRSS